ncbi:hypothetical protein N9N28_16290 [Rubripirellula amarantea]|nr:hypothetical protein [Rubripirellula amarantea]
MSDSVSFALLAPVPEEHLVSALDVLANQGFVAFGSRKWELFRELDAERGIENVPALIYPSYEHSQPALTYQIAWLGWCSGHVEAIGGAHPQGMQHRPQSTLQYADDNKDLWVVFWHVMGLRRLDEVERKPLSSLLSYKSGKYWKAGTPPRGPEIVARPTWFDELMATDARD